MNKSKKVLLISLLPVFLTLLFIVYVLVPSIQNMDKTYKELKEEQAAYNEAESKLNTLKSNQKLKNSIAELNSKLNDFNYKFPVDNELSVFLVDLEKYAQSYNVKVISLSSSNDKEIKIIDPKQEELEKKNKNKKSRRNVKKEISPVKLSQIPLDINAVGYYTDIIKFVNFLENYQRQIVIDGIKVNGSKEIKGENQEVKPKLEISLKAKVYTFVEQEVNLDQSNEEKL